MWRMLKVDTPEDFVLATGTGNLVREFLSLAFDQVGLQGHRDLPSGRGIHLLVRDAR
jgi:GDP-D-mannose dehydratase